MRYKLLFPGFVFTSVLASIIALCSCSSKHSFQVPADSGITVKHDIVYGSAKDRNGSNENLTLDMYFPKGYNPGENEYPLVIFMHGGGFHTGDKKSGAAKCNVFADSGFIAVSINYRLGWNKGDDVCSGNVAELEAAGYRAIQDANTAFRFLAVNKDAYGIDTSRIFTCGSSAGAIGLLCRQYLNDGNVKAYYPAAAAMLGSIGKKDHNDNGFSVKGMCSIAGALPDTALLNQSTKNVPVIFFHGEDDKTVPVNIGYYAGCSTYPQIFGSVSLNKILKEKGIPTEIHVYSHTGHGEDGDTNSAEEQVKTAAAAHFFKALMIKNPDATGDALSRVN